MGLNGIPGVFRFWYAENTGMAFGLLSGSTWLLALVTLLAFGIAVWALRPYQLALWPRLALGAAAGGALGNLADRIFYGYVIDMIDLTFMRFAIFNLADAAITVGGVFLAISLILRPGDWRKKEHGTKA